MPRGAYTNFGLAPLALVAALIGIGLLAHAGRADEMAGAEKFAANGGRALGTLNACGADPEEIAAAIKQITNAALQRAVTPVEKEAIQSSFSEGFRAGVKALTSGETTCLQARDDLTKIEDGALLKYPPQD